MEMTEVWRKLQTRKLHNVYASQNIRVIESRRMRWVVHVAGMGEMRNLYRVKHTWKTRHRWDDNVKMVLMDEHDDKPSGSIKDGVFPD
jgi:hypothetical protein